LNNFGLLDSKRLVFGSLELKDAFELGPVMFGHGLMLTASTYAGKMTLAMGYCREMISPEIMGKLMQTVVDELLGQIEDERIDATLKMAPVSI
jgi:NRPS condensation-like uncharacterized protein